MVFCKDKVSPYKRDGPCSWLICFVSFCNNVILFGLLLSFGILLPVISEEFKRSRGETAWIGSLAIGFSFLSGPVAIKIISWIGERPVGMISGTCSALAITISSFASDYWVLYISYGVSFGFFGSCLINSQTLTTRKYFQKKLPMAIGVTTSGASIGVLTVGPLLQVLVDSLGWRGALRVMAGAMLLTGLLCLSFDPNVEDNNEQNSNEKNNKENDSQVKMCCSLWRTPKYTVGTITVFLAFFGLYVPMIHLVTFAKDNQITASKSSLLFIYIGILSTLSRMVVGKIIEKKWLAPIQGVQFSNFLIGISLILFTQAKTYTHFIIFAIFYGFANGAYMVSQAVFYITCFSDLKMASVGWTTGYVFSAIALFIGPPFAGFVADYFGSYIPTFYVFGSVVVFSGTLPFCLLCCTSKTKAARSDSASIEAQSKIIGYRLAYAESSINVSSV